MCVHCDALVSPAPLAAGTLRGSVSRQGARSRGPAWRAVPRLVPTAQRLRSALTPRLADSYNAGGQDWNTTAGWAKCGAGQNQSPINIADTTTVYNVRVRQLSRTVTRCERRR